MQLNNDEGNIGIITNERIIENLQEDKNAIINHSREINTLYKIVDKLEQRISTLEKVLQSHAKCIGEMREKKDE